MQYKLISMLLVSCSVLTAACDNTCELSKSQNTMVEAVDDTYEFTWTDDNVTELIVSLQTSETEGEVVWWIAAAPGNTLPSGLRYGEVPPGATVTSAAEDIVEGGKYGVSVLMDNGDQSCFLDSDFSS